VVGDGVMGPSDSLLLLTVHCRMYILSASFDKIVPTGEEV
jgi:hypothetical protein